MNKEAWRAGVHAAAGLLAIGLGAARPCGADTFVPIDQDRFTAVLLDSDCEGQTSDGEPARAFDPFDSLVGGSQQCSPTIFVFANAHHTSAIEGSSMAVFAGAHYSVQSPGSVLASAVSNLSVTFELPRASIFSLSGILLGSGQFPGVVSLAQLTGPGGQTLFSSQLTGPFPFGEATEQALDMELVLDPGVYTIHAQAVAADGIDIAQPIFVGEAALNLTVEIAVLGDFNGDEIVDVVDLLALLAVWGPCGACPEDLDQDGMVGVTDLLALLANWG